MQLKIKKILNNNAVVVMSGQLEKIAIGSGIAFHKKKNDLINPNKVEKMFVMEEHDKFQQLLLQVPEEHFTLSEDIISYAEMKLGCKLNNHIHIALTDHLSFAIERAKEGIHLRNKLLHEIKVLYKKEFSIGTWALHRVKEKLDVHMPIDEAAYIALHLHTAKLPEGNMQQTVRQTTIISDMVRAISEYLQIEIEDDDIAYQRLITHLRFVITRSDHIELHTMDKEMLDMIKKKFPVSFRCSQEVARLLKRDFAIQLPVQELGFIALHIERLQKRSNED
ncbi:PRD domain-containing protein [Bacillus chungangensis]|uniref:PRD domain-containing protein n=1 Tax=Bacillus chungangensis TaxID=587633 RepID=UPI0027D8DF50|nr:PRD domain-containing protein [Bacillus chungangensis]